MSTIVTRKSLALGAIVALATTAFAGTPAHAAGEINVVPSAGTSYSTLITDAFTLETSFAPGVANGNSQLKYQIKTAKASTVRALAGTSAPSASSIGSAPATADATGDASDPTAFVQYVSGTATQTTQRNFLGFKLDGVTYTSDSVDVVVTAFVDSNNDGKLTAGEWATAKTVSFKKYADVTSTIVLDEPKVGDNKIVGHVTLAGLNQDQIQSEVKLQFRKTATTSLDGLDANVGASGAFGGVVAAATTAGDYKATTASVDTLDSTDTVELTATVATYSVGTKVVKTATDRTISEIKATVDASDNGLTTNVARTNKPFSVTALVKDRATTPAAAAGVALTATIGTSLSGAWSTTAGSEQSVTVNGTKYSTYATLVAASIPVTTDAKGKAVVNIQTANFTSDDALDVTFSAQNLSVKVNVDFQDAQYTITDDASASYRKIDKNSSATLNFSVKDQFKVLSAATNQRVVISSDLGTKYVAVVAGKASATITPTKDSTDAVAVTATLQASATATNGNVTWSDNGTQLGAALNVVVSAVADSFDTTPVLATVNGASWSSTSTAKQALATGDATDTTPNAATITGSVLTRGANLTVSGAGLRFVIGGTAYTDTVTLPIADANGDFTVSVASVKSGAQVVTLTTGSVSKTVSITFATAVISQLKNTVVAAPTQAQAGRAVNITATLTDANGNAVAGKTVKFAVSGVGTLSSSDAVTDANGVATVRLVSSYGEDGDSVVTVSHNGSDEVADTSATTTPNDFTLVKTVTFGLTDASIDNVNNRVTAVASYSKGKTVGFYVDGVKKWSKVSTSDADVVINYNLKKGRHTVTVKISGGFISSEVIVVQ
jgi:Bacterial Ig-like domain (group 1)